MARSFPYDDELDRDRARIRAPCITSGVIEQRSARSQMVRARHRSSVDSDGLSGIDVLTPEKLRTSALDRLRLRRHAQPFRARSGRQGVQAVGPGDQAAAGATEDDHLALLGLLNSSTACFWMKQVCHQQRGRPCGSGRRRRSDEPVGRCDDEFAWTGLEISFRSRDAAPTELAARARRL